MQIILNLKNEKNLAKLLTTLKNLKEDEIEIKFLLQEQTKYSDEYIEKNWKKLISKALSKYKETYYKSEQYKIDRANYLLNKDI